MDGIPALPLPDDPDTRRVLEAEVDAWWSRLDLGQRVAVAQPYVERFGSGATVEVIDGEVVDERR